MGSRGWQSGSGAGRFDIPVSDAQLVGDPASLPSSGASSTLNTSTSSMRGVKSCSTEIVDDDVRLVGSSYRAHRR